MSEIRTFGIELEGGIYYQQTKERVNLCEVLGLNHENNFSLAIPRVADVGTDNGYHEIEFSLTPCSSLAEMEMKLEKCISWLKPDWDTYWVGQDPFVRSGSLSPCPWAPKPRYEAIRKVVARESGYPDTGPCMDWMSQYWAYQIHLGIDPTSEKGCILHNYLDNWGPHIARSACERLSSLSDRIERAWIGWGNDRRLPGYRWFESPSHMADVWQRTPRLAHKPNGVWIPDEREELPELGDPIHETFVWWGTRPRYTLKTIEFRWPDALPPKATIKLTGWILAFAGEIMSGWKPFRFSKEEWEEIRFSHSYWLGFVRQHPDIQIFF